MIKDLKIFDAVSKVFKPSVEIYVGPIHKVYAEDFKLVKDKAVYRRKDIITKKNAYFYKNGLDYINIEHDCVLPTQEEANDYCIRTMRVKQLKLTEVLKGLIDNPKEKRRFLEDVTRDSSCIYAAPSEIKYSHTISNSEFKELIKTRKVNNNDNPIKK